MIKNITIENFKAWKKLEVEFGKVTALFGANSSGKSSLIHFLLMLKETKSSTDNKIALDFGGDGKNINLGSFADVVHKNGAESKSIEWKIDWQADEEVKIDNPAGKKKDFLVRGRDLSVHVKVSDEQALKIDLLEYRIDDLCFGIKPQIDKKRGGYELFPTNSPPNVDGFGFVRAKGRRWALPAPTKSYLFPDQAQAYYKNSSLLGDLEFSYEKDFIDKIFYLGPLRDFPHREYNWSGVSPTDVGQQGKNTINAILAATSEARKIPMRKRGRKYPFQECVAKRLVEMGLVDSFGVREIAKETNIYQAHVQIKKNGKGVLLTDVGFGISQVLPAIVLLNYVPEKSIVILEQPEIHLHPKVQMTLADAILEIAEARDLQVIVESHSEHFLNRILRRTAEGRYDENYSKLYFVSQSNAGVSKIDYLQMNLYGEIANWPKDFFADSLGEAIETRKSSLKRRIKDEEEQGYK